jgi:HSP20 family protein
MAMSLMRPFSDLREQLDKIVSETRVWMPAIEVSENPEAFIIRAELPGVEPDDLEVTVEGSTVVISGEVRELHDEVDENVHRCELHYGPFQRKVPLSMYVRSDLARAMYRNGVLILTLPKPEESRNKRVKIRVDHG